MFLCLIMFFVSHLVLDLKNVEHKFNLTNVHRGRKVLGLIGLFHFNFDKQYFSFCFEAIVLLIILLHICLAKRDIMTHKKLCGYVCSIRVS